MIVASLGFAAALVVVFPALADPSQLMLGVVDGEAYVSAWVLTWGQDELLAHGLPPYMAADLNFPNGRGLQVLGLIDAILLLPLRVLGRPILTYNAAVALEVFTAAVAAWLFLRSMARDLWPVLPAILAFALTPFLISTVNGGPFETFTIGWLPLALLALRPLWREPTLPWWRTLIAGLVFGAVFLGNPYYFVFVGCAAVALALAQLGRVPLGRLLTRALGAGLAAAAVALPQVWAIRRSVDTATTVDLAASSPELRQQLFEQTFTVDLLAFLLPRWAVDLEGARVVVYIGMVLIALALLGARRPGSRRWLVVAVGSLLFGMGAYLEVAGFRFAIGDWFLPGPAKPLCTWLPPFTSILHPFRVVPVTVLALSALAVLGLDRLRGPRRRLLCVGAAILVLADQLWLGAPGLPVSTVDAHTPDFYEQLGDDPERYPVLDLLGTGSPHNPGHALLFQHTHDKPLLYGVRPPDEPWASNQLVMLGDWDVATRGAPPIGDAFCDHARDAGAMGLRYVVKHHWDPTPDPRADALAGCGFPVVRQDEQVTAWQLDRDR